MPSEKISEGTIRNVLYKTLNEISDSVTNCRKTVSLQMANAMEFIALAERNGVNTDDFIEDFSKEVKHYTESCPCPR